MRKEAEKMNSACQKFYAFIPIVRTDLQAIPTEGTDQNYVDRWLEKQKKMIEEKCTVGNHSRQLIRAITGREPASTGKAITR
jgi:hypothetical protein